MENPIYEFKEELKALAAFIKSERKEGNRASYESYLFRNQHIAYCELRGKTRKQIEVPREGNEPSEYEIDKTKKKWLTKITEWREENEKALCSGD